MLSNAPQIPEYHNLTLEQVRARVLPSDKPAVFRGLANHWPAVKAGRESNKVIRDYLQALNPSGQVDIFTAPATAHGRMFYAEGLEGLTFKQDSVPFGDAINEIYCSQGDEKPTVYCGSVRVKPSIEQFSQENSLDFFDDSVVPRLWIGNKVTVAAHYDLSHNFACVVAGRRRFTLFPPEQISNLYIGPIDFTLAGRPASMVSFDEPDLEKYPRFTEAVKHAQVAELEPGDVIYIPPMWWHHVESLDDFNVLANYWWMPTVLGGDSAYEAMLHGLLTISALPAHERKAWHAFYDHYVFRTESNPADHIPVAKRGVLGAMTPQLYERIRTFLYKSMGLKR